MQKIKPSSWFFVLFFSIGGIVWALLTVYLTSGSTEQKQAKDTDYSIRQSGYTFINPLLECEIQSKGERQKYIPFETKTIERIKKEIIAVHTGITLGVYVRNLNNGPWFGINENEYYSPASLMKVPVLITYLKWMELDATIRDKQILLEEDGLNTSQYYEPTTHLITGKSYSAKELLEEMIVYSDNRSMAALMRAIPIDIYVRVNTDLGITVPGARTPENYLSVKEVATFFRILYNASYLDRASSEYALELLSRVTFDSGLRAWVPTSVPISHKFGERGYTDDTSGKEIRQLHDCGVVYYGPYPYLACIVTKGDDFDTDAQVIAATSRIIFEEISRAFPVR